jgi:hypothetical protein
MKKIYVFLLGLCLSLVAFAQSPTCNWYPTCGNSTWLTTTWENSKSPSVKPVAKAYYFAPGLFTNDTDAFDYLWNASPADSIPLNGYIGVDGSPSTGNGWAVPPAGFTSQAKLLYDNNYLYVLQKVTDNSVLFNSNSGTTGLQGSTNPSDQYEVEVAPYDSFTNVNASGGAIAATDYQDEFALWNGLGARKLTYFLDGYVSQYNYLTAGQDPASNGGFYDCWISTRLRPYGYESLMLVSFTWAMSNGANATQGGTAFVPTEGSYIAFNVTDLDYDAGTNTASYCQAAWSTNDNDIWATMEYCGKVEFMGPLPSLPCNAITINDGLCDNAINNTVKNDAVTIISSNPVADEIQFSAVVKEVKVIDLVGKVVAEANQTDEISVSGLANGLYIVNYVSEDNQTFVQKVIKK